MVFTTTVPLEYEPENPTISRACASCGMVAASTHAAAAAANDRERCMIRPCFLPVNPLDRRRPTIRLDSPHAGDDGSLTIIIESVGKLSRNRASAATNAQNPNDCALRATPQRDATAMSARTEDFHFRRIDSRAAHSVCSPPPCGPTRGRVKTEFAARADSTALNT